MVKKIILELIIALLFAGCGNYETFETQRAKEIEVGILKMDIPESYRFEAVQGIDSYVARIIGIKKDTLQIEYGDHGIIYNLYEVPAYAIPMEKKDEIVRKRGLPPLNEAVFSKYAEDDNRKNIFDKNYYRYDTVSNIVVQFVVPKKIGEGMSGMFIPELKNGKSFSIYGTNLDSAGHTVALNIFKSVRYK
jgi:hypothetical protein